MSSTPIYTQVVTRSTPSHVRHSLLHVSHHLPRRHQLPAPPPTLSTSSLPLLASVSTHSLNVVSWSSDKKLLNWELRSGPKDKKALLVLLH
uniref:Uncharacterized protein n=1 Tax=Arundo donax TaxID=35708 RepID=A0A0A8ZJQ6_ARUDO